MIIGHKKATIFFVTEFMLCYHIFCSLGMPNEYICIHWVCLMNVNFTFHLYNFDEYFAKKTQP